MMNGASLADLDELVLQCRHEKARGYIAEAVACYKVGAYRSAVVGTWIAVAYDILDKMHELALAGDQEAERQVEEFDRIRRADDVSRALKFEKQLLTVARDRFELISHLEWIDLDRLHEDRHRCAHPALISEDEIFAPSAELARTHIRTAVIHLLRHPPAQGKYALERLLKDVASDYFPTETAKAVTALSNGPLRRPRDSLVRNFAIVLLKDLFSGTLELRERSRRAAALAAVKEMHPLIFSGIVADKASNLARAAEDEVLPQLLDAVRRVPDLWDHFGPDVRQRLEACVRQFPLGDIEDLYFPLDFAPLRDAALHRIAQLRAKDLEEAILIILHDDVAEHIVRRYVSAQSYAAANRWGKIVATNAVEFSEAQVERIIAGAAENDEVRDSFELHNVINSLRARARVDKDWLDRVLIAKQLWAPEVDKDEDVALEEDIEIPF